METYISTLLFVLVAIIVFIRRDTIDFSVTKTGNFFVVKDFLKMLLGKGGKQKEEPERKSEKNIISDFSQGKQFGGIFDKLQEELETHDIKNILGDLKNWNEELERLVDIGGISERDLSVLKRTNIDVVDLESRVFIMRQIEKGGIFKDLYEKGKMMTLYNKKKKELYTEIDISVQKKKPHKNSKVLHILYRFTIYSAVLVLLVNSFMTEEHHEILRKYRVFITEMMFSNMIIT